MRVAAPVHATHIAPGIDLHVEIGRQIRPWRQRIGGVSSPDLLERSRESQLLAPSMAGADTQRLTTAAIIP